MTPQSMKNSKLLPLVGSKSGQQTFMVHKFVIISRIADKETRDQLELDDAFVRHSFYFSEREAQQDYEWLKRKSEIREFVLVAIPDLLDDDIPF